MFETASERPYEQVSQREKEGEGLQIYAINDLRACNRAGETTIRVSIIHGICFSLESIVSRRPHDFWQSEAAEGGDRGGARERRFAIIQRIRTEHG